MLPPEAIRRRDHIIEVLRMFEMNLPRAGHGARAYIIDQTPEYISQLHYFCEREVASATESWYYYQFPFRKPKEKAQERTEEQN